MTNMSKKVPGTSGLQPQQAFGIAVHERRVALGLSQEMLAERCDMDRTYISGIERGVRNPTIQVIWTIAGGLEIPASTLLVEAERIMRGS